MSSRISNYVIPLISLLLIVIVLMIIVIIITPQLYPSVSTLTCPKGYCSNNIYSGEKICPPSLEGYVQYHPESEVCNPPNGCLPSSKTPCTYYDPILGTQCPGDLEYTGICPDNTNCKCLDRIYCPDFAQTYFELVTVENPGTDILESQAFLQNTIWISPTNAPRNDLPLSLGVYGQTGFTTCGLSTNNVKFVWPPGACIRGQLGFNEPDSLWYCMDSPINCSSGQYPIRDRDGNYRCETVIPDPFEI